MLVDKQMRLFVLKEFWNELYQWVQEWKYNKTLPIKKVKKIPNQYKYKQKHIIIYLKNNECYKVRIYCRCGKWCKKPTDFDVEINLFDVKEMYFKQKAFQKYLDHTKKELFDFLKNKIGD